MEPRTLQFIADACGGVLHGGSPGTSISRIVTDSRKVQAGDAFLALAGEKYDGHDFVGEVAPKVAAVIIDKTRLGANLPCPAIAVENTRRALGLIAVRYRNDFDIPLIAVGGSNGKTTTKELIASVLKEKFPAAWSEASFNNDIGVPLTLLKIENSHRAAVLEVGTNHPGELAPLLQMIRPRFSVITSIGREHLEFFGDISGVVKEEGALAEILPSGGKLLVNGENPWIKPIVKRTRAAIVKVGQAASLAKVWGEGWAKQPCFCARNVRMDDSGVTFSVVAPQEKYSGDYRVNLLGRHQIVNSLLAVAVGAELGLSREEIQRGLAQAQPAKMRMQVWTAGEVRFLDDAYNANTDSVLAALQTLKEFPCPGRRVAVLGDMAELGTFTAESHHEVGREAAKLGVDQLFAVGKMAGETASGARGAGLSNITIVPDVDSAGEVINQFIRPGDVVLLKASRASKFERIAEALKRNKDHSG